MLNSSQRGIVAGKTDCTGARTGCESSCSTATSDVAVSDISSESDDDKEMVRDFGPADVDWLLTALSKEQKVHLDRSPFHRECHGVFRMMDKDASGFLDISELEQAISHLIPEPHRAISSEDGHRLMLSIQSVLTSFDKDSDRQLSGEEFHDFVRFCYAWRSQQEQMKYEANASDTVRPASRGRLAREQLQLNGSSNNVAISASCSRLAHDQEQEQSHVASDPITTVLLTVPAQEQLQWATQSESVRPTSRGRLAHLSLPCGSAHRLVRSASTGHVAVSPQPKSTPRRLPPTSMKRSSSNPIVQPHRSRQRVSNSNASSRRNSPEPVPPSVSTSKSNAKLRWNSVRRAVRSASISAPGSAASSRRPSKSLPSQSASSSRIPSPEPAPSSKPHHRDDLGTRQMRGLKALLKELVGLHKTLPELVTVLMHNVMAPDSTQAFTKDDLEYACSMVVEASKERYSPRSFGPVTTISELDTFMQQLGHSATHQDTADEAVLLVDRAIQVVVLLSLRWFPMKDNLSLPEMSDYQKQSWLPPAFSYLVGQVLWRHRTAGPLQHTSVVENLRWITSVPDAREDMIDQINTVFKIFSGGDGRVKLSQWRKVVELLASNPELRPRIRRCEPVRACYGDMLGHSEEGLSRKSFKLMLVKTADLITVHPFVLFKELASHAETLQRDAA